MVRKPEAARGGPTTVSFMAPATMVKRAESVARWIDAYGLYPPLNGGDASMSHVYRIIMDRGLDALEKEMKK